MNNGQLDLFSAPAPRTKPELRVSDRIPCVDASVLTDEAVVAAIPHASIAESVLLAGEAGRRRLAAAVPALEKLCQQLTGFGNDSLVPEQVAALEALSMIGGSEAAQAVVRILARGAVRGPNLAIAVETAVHLKAKLPPDIALQLLRDDNPLVRANACRCARFHSATLPVLIDLLNDLHAQVGIAAACALGRMGRLEARPILIRLLQEAPNAEMIDATPAVADEECCVLLGRIARDRPPLASLALDALNAIENPRAERIIAGIVGAP